MANKSKETRPGEKPTTDNKQNRTLLTVIIGSVVVIVILLAGTAWMGRRARQDTEDAVRAVSLLYLDELAGRREQVVENNLQRKTNDIRVALAMLDAENLSSEESLQAWQRRIRQIYGLQKFAFVDEDGLIHTADGLAHNLADYHFDPATLDGPSISVISLDSPNKRVVIALPVRENGLTLAGKALTVCFVEIDMQEMLQGVSMESQSSGATFCNIYTSGGIALSNTVLGGLAEEDNLLTALSRAKYDSGYSYEQLARDFSESRRGEVSFTYGDVRETLAYVPVAGTDWLLTYLIRESVISDKISSISTRTLQRSILQSLLTVAVLVILFSFIVNQMRRNARLVLEKETADAASRARQADLEQQLTLQEQLLEDEKLRTRQDQMITAMASDYRSVYHVDLEKDEAVCYRADPGDPDQYTVGERFAYRAAFENYAHTAVTDGYREGFLRFIDPDNLRTGLLKEPILAYRYLAQRDGREYYEMIRAAGVRQADERTDGIIHAVGMGFTVIDEEMRQSMAQQQALSDALSAAEQASRAKTAFLSSMSHEIRTPMNAIIGLDTIALNDPATPETTKEYLKKIGVSAEHLLSLINDILDMSRIESGRMTLKHEVFSFARLLEAINNMFSAQCADRKLEYQCHVEGAVDACYVGDSMKLRQVLINILGNAVKFTPEGGSVTLTVRRTARFSGRSTLRFIIADTGIGMSADFLPRLFDSFAQEDVSSTSRYGSSGLGMAITKSIVDMMNGTIEVDSEKGRGSVFTVTVTLDECEQQEDRSLSAGAELQPGELSVLVVDDDPVACEHARLALAEAGITAETACSGAKAIEMVQVHQARMQPYNLILMDWKMPDMDGVETTRRIRSIVNGQSAIIFLTAYRWDDVVDEARAAGVDSFLSKPVFADSVMEEFRTALQRRDQASAESARKANLEGRRILLAEDVPVNAEIMAMLLEMRGMETDHAENGKIALQKFEEHPEGWYSAILMDMRMPEMDGLEATRAIRALPRPDAAAIPIIALTANAFDEDVQRSMQAGLNAHLSKPVEPDILFETLENLITP